MVCRHTSYTVRLTNTTAINHRTHEIIVSVQVKAGTSTGRRTVTADPVDVGLFLFTPEVRGPCSGPRHRAEFLPQQARHVPLPPVPSVANMEFGRIQNSTEGSGAKPSFMPALFPGPLFPISGLLQIHFFLSLAQRSVYFQKHVPVFYPVFYLHQSEGLKGPLDHHAAGNFSWLIP